MTIALGVSSVSSTAVYLTLSGWGASGTVEIQIAPRRDFQFCVAPTIPGFPRTSDVSHVGLNQRANYYARARTRLADGTAESWSNIVGFRTTDGTAQTLPTSGVLIEPAMVVPPLPFRVQSATGSIAGYPFENLGRDAAVAYRATPFLNSTVYQVEMVVEIGGEPIDTLALLNTNLPEDAVWAANAYPTSALTSPQTLFGFSPFRASANLPGRMGYHGLQRFAEVKGCRFVQIVIASPSNFRVLHAEQLVIGKARVSKNVSRDKGETPNPLTTVDRRRSGAPDRQPGLPMRKVEFDLSAISETQYETLYGDLHRYAGEPALVIPNSRANAFLHDRILFGDLQPGRAVMQNANVFTRSFTVDSII